MNCPYCDESISLAAKFCPKCGLPLKDDATLMGASWSGEAGPNRWLIAAGATAIVAVALSIGWMSTHNGQSDTTTRREALNVTPGVVAPGSVTPYPNAPYPGWTPATNFTRPSTQAAYNTGSSVSPAEAHSLPNGGGWAPLPPLARLGRTPDELPSTAPSAPAVNITKDVFKHRTPPSVTASWVVTPEVPTVVMPQVSAEPSAVINTLPQSDGRPSGGGWEYDPVQGRWARVPGRDTFRASGGTANRVSPRQRMQEGSGNRLTAPAQPGPAQQPAPQPFPGGIPGLQNGQTVDQTSFPGGFTPGVQ